MKPLVLLLAATLLANAAPPAGAESVADVGQTLARQAIDPLQLPATTVYCSIRNSPFVVLRAEPKLESAAVATLLPADKILIIGRSGDWVNATTNKGTGFLRSYYLLEPAGVQVFNAGDLKVTGTSGAATSALPPALAGTTLTTSPADSATPTRISDPAAPTPPDIPTASQPPSDRSWLNAFDKTLTFSDAEFTDKDALTREQIQDFLVKKNSVLANPIDGIRPADAVYAAAQKYNISPKALLARLQTEQGLIGKKTATQKQLDWALGVGCYDSGNWNEAFRGIDKQIDGAAKTYRKWYDEGVKQGSKVAMTIDGEKIVTQNAATFSIYKYCPHFSGAKLNFDVYKGYFGK